MKGKKRITSARGHAVIIVKGVIDQHLSLTYLLAQHQQTLPEEQHPFLSQLCYGTLRWYVKLDYWLGKLMRKPLKPKDREVHFILITGLFQLAYLDKAKHAVINETVNLTRNTDKPWAAGLVNGVLRNFTRQHAELQESSNLSESVALAMPEWFFNVVKPAWPRQYRSILARLNERAPMTLRVNPQHFQTDEYLLQLQQHGMSARMSDLATQAIMLEQPCDVGDLPGFYQGHCSVQDEAAQLVTACLQPAANQRVLDACCAPGGKTAALLEIEPSLQVLAVDIDDNRQQRTRLTLERLGLTASIVSADATQIDQWWDGQEFDHILLDAPCSATGVIRRHPDIKHLRRPDDIRKLIDIQSKLVSELWSALKPGGSLLYVTCSILPQENTNIIADFLSSQPDVKVKSLSIEGDTDVEFGCQFLPQTQGHDGFYYCLLEKTH